MPGFGGFHSRRGLLQPTWDRGGIDSTPVASTTGVDSFLFQPSSRRANVRWGPPTNQTTAAPGNVGGGVDSFLFQPSSRRAPTRWGPPTNQVGTPPVGTAFYERPFIYSSKIITPQRAITMYWEPPAEIATPAATPFYERGFLYSSRPQISSRTFVGIWEPPTDFVGVVSTRRRVCLSFID